MTKRILFRASFDEDFEEIRDFYAANITSPEILADFLEYVLEEMIRCVKNEHLDGPVVVVDGHELRSFLICRSRFRVFYEVIDESTRGVVYLRHIRQER